MIERHIDTIAADLRLDRQGVQAVAVLISEGATVPFIARYRKEATGSLDEVAVTGIRDRMVQLEELDTRRETILKSLEKHGHLTDELEAAVRTAETLSILEDIYLPYRPKRRTKGIIAREKGLEPLAEEIFAQQGIDPFAAAEAFVDTEKKVATSDEALAGARDIIAEWINEDATARQRQRDLFFSKGTCSSRLVEGKEKEGAKFKDYFDWEEPVAGVPSHRLLAMRRGEKEDILNLTIAPPETEALDLLTSLFVKGDGEDCRQVALAAEDAYKRLLSRSMETEVRLATKEKADAEAITVFADNLQELLLAPPLGSRRTMGIDPGFRTGCKVVCLDRQGKMLHHDTVYLHLTEKKDREGAEKLKQLCDRYAIEAIAVGNGTAGRETVRFVRGLGLPEATFIELVNESGASIYSASETARKEFPDLDLTIRGSISIARRLMDPLSELVKIDPKSIGVGQYQHDVDQAALKKSLDDMVMRCVNRVGVDVNRASVQLLTYVSGLGPGLARNIVAFRDENGPFANRSALQQVHRLGPRAFEQCAGFLRITGGDTPLDASAVHPESYAVVDAMAGDLGCDVAQLMGSADRVSGIDISKYITPAIGEPTLKDILSELARPGRDPRRRFETFRFAKGIETLQDLQTGMKLPGIVTNVTRFGAFVDIGVHQDGLVHISELADHFVANPADVVKVQQKVTVTVLDIDHARKRISLSMKSTPGREAPSKNMKKAKKKGAAPARTGKQAQSAKRPAKAPFNNAFADLAKLKR